MSRPPPPERSSCIAVPQGLLDALAALVSDRQVQDAGMDWSDVRRHWPDATGGALGALLDALEAALPRQRRSLPAQDATRAFFDYSPTGIVQTNADGVIQRVNPAACSITGQPPHRLRGHRMEELLQAGASTAARWQRHQALVAEQGVAHCELSLQPGNSAGTCVVALASVDVGNGERLHILDDVTEQREAMAALRKAQQQADTANEAKSRFLAHMSHEIRTPLNGIIGLTQLLLTSGLSTEQRSATDSILRASRDLLAILNDLLDLSKIEAGRLEIEELDFSLHAVLDGLQATYGPLAQSKGLQLTVASAPDVPHALRGDPLRLSQVLGNLLSNAVKFTRQGDVRLEVSTRDSGALPIWISYAVTDTGVGIDATTQSRLFQPFEQGDVSTTRRFGGTGLGLAIARLLVESMQGEIGVSSQPGSGTRFEVHLPFGRAQTAVPAGSATPVPDRQHNDADEIPQAFAGCRILVAEDNEISQRVMEGVLARAMIDTRIVADGQAALVAAADPTWVPDLVLMDVQMPVLDGLSATRALRARGQSFPVVGLSAGATEGERLQCEAAGMNAFLAKPIDFKDLFAAFSRWIGPRPDTAQPASTAAGAASNARTPDTPGANSHHLPATVSGMDLAGARERFLGNEALLARLLSQFLDHVTSLEPVLRAHCTAGRHGQISAVAHQLCGAAANLGAIDIAAAARQLELATHANDRRADAPAPCSPDDIAPMITTMMSAVVALRAALAP